MALAASAPRQQGQYALTNRRRHSFQSLQPDSSEPRSPRLGRRRSSGADAGGSNGVHRRFVSEPPEPRSPRKLHAAGEVEGSGLPQIGHLTKLPQRRASTGSIFPETQSNGTQNGHPNKQWADEKDQVDDCIKAAIEICDDTLKINGAIKGASCLDISGTVEESKEATHTDDLLQKLSSWNWTPAESEEKNSTAMEKLESRTKGLEQRLLHVEMLARTLDKHEAGDATMSGLSIYNSLSKSAEGEEVKKVPGPNAKHHEKIPDKPDKTKLLSTWGADMAKAELPDCIMKAAPSLARQVSDSSSSAAAPEATVAVRRRSADVVLSPITAPVREVRRTSMPFAMLEPSSPKTPKSSHSSPKNKSAQLRLSQTGSL